VRQERWKVDFSSLEVEQKLGGMGIVEEKSWRKEDKDQGDQTKTSTRKEKRLMSPCRQTCICARAEVEEEKEMWTQGEGEGWQGNAAGARW
jgi:hypothetical protein